MRRFFERYYSTEARDFGIVKWERRRLSEENFKNVISIALTGRRYILWLFFKSCVFSFPFSCCDEIGDRRTLRVGCRLPEGWNERKRIGTRGVEGHIYIHVHIYISENEISTEDYAVDFRKKAEDDGIHRFTFSDDQQMSSVNGGKKTAVWDCEMYRLNEGTTKNHHKANQKKK